MENIDNKIQFYEPSANFLEDEIIALKSMLASALGISSSEIKVSFPSLNNFYVVNNVYKASWAIYTNNSRLPKLLYTGNFLIQGGQYGNRSIKSPFGTQALSSLTSIANTFSYEASFYKQNWTLDLNLFEEDSEKLKFSVKEYQEFLKLLNTARAKWLLYLSEEGNFDFVIIEFSEPSDPLFFMNLENFDSTATKIKTYFKPISQNSLNLFQSLSLNTEFEGKFFNLQPGTWLMDDVLIEMEKFYSENFFDDKNIKFQKLHELEVQNLDNSSNNPFKTQVLKPSY